MVEFTTKWLAGAIIAIIVMVIMIVGPGKVFDRIKETAKDTSNYVNIGAKEEVGAKPEIPEEHQKALKKLIQTMGDMRDSIDNNCFANYQIGGHSYGLPELGEKGTSFTFTYDPKIDSTRVIVKGGKEGVHELTQYDQELKGIKLCVIAGGDVASHFFNRFLANQRKAEGGYFKEVDSITISYGTSGFSPGNIIRAGIPEVDSTNHNLQDGGWVFMPDDKHICFFPTEDGTSCEAAQNGLQDNCLAEDPADPHSIPYLTATGELTLCREEKGFSWLEVLTAPTASPGLNILSGRCPVGEACHTRSAKCDSHYESVDVGSSGNGKNCRLLIQADDGCGYVGVRPGTKINKKDGEILIDTKNMGWYGDEIGKLLNSGNFFVSSFSNPDDSFTCGKDGLWNVQGYTEGLIGEFMSESAFQFGCVNRIDDDKNGKTDCEDSGCSTNLACIQYLEKGQIQRNVCFDGVDNEVITSQDGAVAVGDNNGLIDCKDPNCENVEYQNKKCVHGEVITTS